MQKNTQLEKYKSTKAWKIEVVNLKKPFKSYTKPK